MIATLWVWTLLVTALWALVLLGALRASRENPYRVGRADAAAPSNVAVSVIVPARNEVGNIDGIVASVLAQDHPALELVVLDDGSTDGTLERLRAVTDPRLRVVEGGGGALPEGWLGKPWACHRAAGHATGAYLLFVDADVRLAPEAVSRAVAYAQEHGLGLLSGLGNALAGTLAEEVLQPAINGLILAGNDLKAVNDPARPEKALANGQFLLFSRTAYGQLGGHSAVAGNVLDDVGLALAAKRANIPFRLVFMRDLFSVRMYQNGRELWRGWRKNLFAGIGRSWPKVLAVELSLLLTLVGPYLLLFFGLWNPIFAFVALPAVAAIQATRWVMDGLFGLPRTVGLWSHGLAYALVMLLILDSALSATRGSAQWKGRTLPKKA